MLIAFDSISRPSIGQISNPVSVRIDQFHWFNPLSEPVRTKTFHVSLQQFQPYLETAQFPEVISEDKYHFPWSEPVRIKPLLQTGDQPFFYTEQIPVVSFSWFNQLSERNVKILSGLRTDLQQFLAIPSRILPTPTVFLTWISQEQYDMMNFSNLSQYRTPVKAAKVGIIEIAPGNAYAAIAEPN